MSKVKKASIGLFVLLVVGLMILPQQLYAGRWESGFYTKGTWTKGKFGSSCQDSGKCTVPVPVLPPIS